MPACPKHPSVQLKQMKKGWYCEDCEANVISYDELPRDAPAPQAVGLDLSTLPFPVAHPLAYARDEALEPTLRLNNAVFAAFQAMRTAGLLLLADYLDVATSDRALEVAIRGLRMPHWGEWTDLCNRLVAFWSGPAEGKPERPSHFPSLVEGWRGVAMEKATGEAHGRLKGLPGMQGPARNANDALWKLRNERAHRMATHTPGRPEEAERLGLILPVVEDVCRALFRPGAFQLLRRVGPGGLEVLRAHGPHRELDFQPETLDAAWEGLLAQHEVVALCGEEGVSVYPLFSPDDGREAVTLVEAVKRKSLLLLGVRSAGESEAHFGPLARALEKKRVDMGLGREETRRWTVAEWSRTQAREDVAALLHRKYFPECYVERGGVDGRVSEALQRGGKAVLLLGEAGSGKSSLLTRLVEGLLVGEEAPAARKKRTAEELLLSVGDGDVVLYLTGRQAFSGDGAWSGTQLLVEAVQRRAGVRSGTFSSLKDFLARLDESALQDSSRGRRVWLVLDALNEAERFADVVKAVDEVLPEVGRYPWLRLVLSCRAGAYASLERRHVDMAQHGGVFANEAWLARFYDDVQKKDVPYQVVRPFEERTEAPEAYRRRAEAYPERACGLPWVALPGPVKELLRNPLHLHVFHETYAGRADVGAHLDEASLLEAWLGRLGDELPALRETLERVGQYLVQHHVAALPAEVADGWLDEWRRRQGFSSADRVVKLDPIEELVSASVLMRPANEGFGVQRQLVAFAFSHQKLCEAVVLRELRRQVLPRTDFDEADLFRFAAEAEAHPDFSEYLGALRTVVTQAAKAGRGDFVASLLDVPGDAARGALLSAAVRAIGLAWELAGARATLAALAAKAGASEVQRRRWLQDSDEADWLTRRGATVAALALAEARLEATREGGAATVEDSQARAGALRDVADRLQVLGRSEEARRHVEESLAISRRLSEAEPARADLAQNVVAALNRLGDLAEAEGRTQDAWRRFEECLAISRRLSEAEPAQADLARSLAVSLDRLGGLAEAEGRSEEARRCFEECLAISRRLSEAEPARADLARDVGGELERLGALAQAEGRSEEARRCFEEYLGIARRLWEAEPARADLAQDVGVSLGRLGNLTKDEGRSEEAWRCFDESLSVARRLSEAEPSRADLARDVGVSHYRLGGLAQAEGRSEEARRRFEESLAIARRLSEAEPARADLARELGFSLGGLGALAQAEGRNEEARRCFEEALSISRRLSEVEPTRADVGDLALAGVSLIALGELALAEGRSDEARRWLEELRLVAQRNVAAHPDSATWANAEAWANVLLARLHAGEGESAAAFSAIDGGLPAARRSVAIRSELENQDTLAALLELKATLVSPNEAHPLEDEALGLRRAIVSTSGDAGRSAALIALLRQVAGRRGGPEADALEAEARGLEAAAMLGNSPRQ